jgi:hypothetical protein
MVIDPVCSIVFEAEGEEADTMRRPPRDPTAPLFSAGFAAWSLLQGSLVLVLVACLFVMALHQGLPDADARALAFTALVATNLGLVLSLGEMEWYASVCRLPTAPLEATLERYIQRIQAGALQAHHLRDEMVAGRAEYERIFGGHLNCSKAAGEVADLIAETERYGLR